MHTLQQVLKIPIRDRCPEIGASTRHPRHPRHLHLLLHPLNHPYTVLQILLYPPALRLVAPAGLQLSEGGSVSDPAGLLLLYCYLVDLDCGGILLLGAGWLFGLLLLFGLGFYLGCMLVVAADFLQDGGPTLHTDGMLDLPWLPPAHILSVLHAGRHRDPHHLLLHNLGHLDRLDGLDAKR